jgi:hypothetical protein
MQSDDLAACALAIEEQKAPYHTTHAVRGTQGKQRVPSPYHTTHAVRGTQGKQRVPSPFILFATEKRESVTKLNPGAMMTQIAAIIGQMWNAMSPEEKNVYRIARDRLKVEQGLSELQL